MVQGTADLTGEPGPIPSTHVVTHIVCNASSRRSDAFFWFPQPPCSHWYTHIYRQNAHTGYSFCFKLAYKIMGFIMILLYIFSLYFVINWSPPLLPFRVYIESHGHGTGTGYRIQTGTVLIQMCAECQREDPVNQILLEVHILPHHEYLGNCSQGSPGVLRNSSPIHPQIYF